MTFFVGNDDDGYEPFEGILTVADGTINSIGNLFAASIINGVPTPAFLDSYVYEYVSNGIKSALKSAPKMGLENLKSRKNVPEGHFVFIFVTKTNIV